MFCFLFCRQYKTCSSEDIRVCLLYCSLFFFPRLLTPLPSLLGILLSPLSLWFSFWEILLLSDFHSLLLQWGTGLQIQASEDMGEGSSLSKLILLRTHLWTNKPFYCCIEALLITEFHVLPYREPPYFLFLPKDC